MAKNSGNIRRSSSKNFDTHRLSELVDTNDIDTIYYQRSKRSIQYEGLDVSKESRIEYLEAAKVKPSEWNDATVREGNIKVSSYVAMGGNRMPPIIAMRNGNGYEAIDGIHRVWAAEEIGMKVPAIVISQRLMDAFGNDAAARDYLYKYYENSIIKNRR